MTKLINTKGVTALATALGLCAYSIAPSNSEIVSKPITPSEARDIKGGAFFLPWALVGFALAADAALTAAAMSLYSDLEVSRQQREGSYARNP